MSNSPILPYSSGLSPLAADAISSLQDRYRDDILSTSQLAAADTRYMLTGSRVTITTGAPPSDSFWVLTEGTADPAYPTDQVAATNSDDNADARYWIKTGGF